MRGRALLAVLFCAAVGAAVEARAAESAIPKDLEACIRGNAESVERAIPGLNDAVTFLVSNICAVEQYAASRAYSDKQVTERKAREVKCRAGHASKAKDPKSDLAAHSACFDVDGISYIFKEPPEGTALAARLLLDLRTKRLEREGRQP